MLNCVLASYSLFKGTNERVCLISGTIDGVLKISEFIMEKIKEKPDPNAKMAIDFDHKQPAEREKQVSHSFLFHTRQVVYKTFSVVIV